MCGVSPFVNRRNWVSRSFPGLTDRELAGPSPQSYKTPDIPNVSGPQQLPCNAQGGCRGTVVGAVVEIEHADAAMVRRGGMRIQEFASFKVTTCRRGETALRSNAVSVSLGMGEARAGYL